MVLVIATEIDRSAQCIGLTYVQLGAFVCAYVRAYMYVCMCAFVSTSLVINVLHKDLQT